VLFNYPLQQCSCQSLHGQILIKLKTWNEHPKSGQSGNISSEIVIEIQWLWLTQMQVFHIHEYNPPSHLLFLAASSTPGWTTMLAEYLHPKPSLKEPCSLLLEALLHGAGSRLESRTPAAAISHIAVVSASAGCGFCLRPKLGCYDCFCGYALYIMKTEGPRWFEYIRNKIMQCNLTLEVLILSDKCRNVWCDGFISPAALSCPSFTWSLT
jgi:hypothetical protein